MTRAVVRLEQADRDAKAAVLHYRAEAGVEVALDFVVAVEAAYETIAAQPGLGSPRYGEELGLPGLRHWPLKRLPYLIFYLERAGRIEIWRILHARRDIGVTMREEQSSR